MPIAEMPVSVLLILGLGAAVGFISGLFGIGGGFLMTPLLIFLGIPPAVAVATQAAQIVASSTTSVLGALRRNALDLRLGAADLAAARAAVEQWRPRPADPVANGVPAPGRTAAAERTANNKS